ncbi:hypothetical protein [Rhizobium leguminosarum]|uniref:hypothetical protein n=1 Tax=Rhizobium leguminosarum TaxID=384 RepID=UPI00102F9C8D|nr:hypothetical protein [Rhizobium leguminosarum]TBG96086.1 hypothetical protein ELG68_36135 [Rhizobium leguminosarum]
MDTLILAQSSAAAAPAPSVADAFAAQLVPTAVMRTPGGNYLIRASVAFTPVPGTESNGEIDEWPSWIAKRFTQDPTAEAEDFVRVLVRRAMDDATGQLSKPAINAFRTAYGKIAADDALALTRLTEIWLTWFDAMPSLRAILRDAATKTAGEKTDMYQDANGGPNGTPDVISVPRTELARQTTLGRARNLIESLAGAQSIADSEMSRQQRDLRKAALPGPAQRPWSKVPLGSARTVILRELLGKTAEDLVKRAASELRLAWALESSQLQSEALEQEAAEFEKNVDKSQPPDATLVAWRQELEQAAKALPTPTDEDKYEPHRWEAMPAEEWAKQLGAYLEDERRWLELTLAFQLAEQRDAAKKYAESCRDCADACSAATVQLADYLGKLKDHRVAHRASHIETSAQSALGTAFDDATAKDAAAQQASTLQDYGRPEEVEAKMTVMQRRWHALQGMPALMRAMHLTMDIEFTLTEGELNGLDAKLTGKGGLADPAYFLEFALAATDPQDGRNLVHQTLWTLTKLRLPADDEQESGGHCWPSTTEEWALRSATKQNLPVASTPEDSGFLDQVDAVIDLDAPLMANGQVFKRYDVFSLDVTIASEAEQRRQAAEAQVRDARTPLPEDDKVPAAKTFERKSLDMPEAEQNSAAETSTLKTGGLQIVDRFRQGAVIDEIFTSCNAQSLEGRRVDANDLLIGYRFDVGLPQMDGSPRHWSSLSSRIVRYSHVAPEDLADLDVVANAFSPPGDDGVRPTDGATVAMGTRLVRNSQSGIASGGKETAFAEQLVVVWDGDPIGMRTGSFEGFAEATDLPVTRVLSLPTSGGSRPHRLRLGGAYALGARAVLVGGVCAPLGRAINMYDGGLGRGMAYPSKASEVQRFLRQERIGPPIVAVEAAILIGEFGSERKGIDGKDMVVRSQPGVGGVDAEDGWRFAPDETARMLFAPLVNLDFAVMHSVFDAAARRLDRAPPGGLQDVDYDSDWGGFPLFDPREPPVAAAIRGTYRRYETHDELGKERPQKITPGGFAVFRKRTKLAAKIDPPRKRQEYYPDPAARELVIALRYPDQPDRYLAGEAIRVSFYATAKAAASMNPGYPDARPVRIKVKAVPSSATPLASHDDLRKRAAEAGVPFTALEPTADGVPVMTLTLCLAPGEDFEVETWCLPSRQSLQAWFDLPEAMALIMGCAIDNASVKSCLSLAQNTSGTADDAILLRRGEASIPWSAVKRAASAVYDTLLRRPLPDIASVRRLRAIHASGLPKDDPVIDEARLLRLSASTQRTWLESGLGPDKDEDGGSNVVVLGLAGFDPDTTETVELHAEAVMPIGGTFDNLELGRNYYGRARGEWPRTQPDPDGQPEPIKKSQRQGNAGKAGNNEPSYMDELFGFDVARDGKAAPRLGQGIVARWPIRRTQQVPADLAALTRQGRQLKDRQRDAEPTDTKSRAVLEGIFPDTLARRVKLWLMATSRTARHIPDRSSYPTPTEAEIDRDRMFRKSRPVREVILPATERPAALTTKSLLPAYVWTNEGSKRERRTKVRIRLRRPWWTSGEDERLGVVVWPPNLMDAKGTLERDEWTNAELEQGIVRRKSPLAPNEGPNEIDLHRIAAPGATAKWREGFFTDADLGIGGSFVTRWGADPIFASEEMAWLIDAAAFRDVSASGADFVRPIDLIATENEDFAAHWLRAERYKPRFVENALMPIPNADDDGTKDEDAEKDKVDDKDKAKSGAAKRTPEFMLVSLVTYTPRFDPDFEHWYVDVDLDVGNASDPFVRFGLVRFQPFAKRHLQVSQPVAEWVQVAGYFRDVSASRIPVDGRDWVKVDIGMATGVASGKQPDAKGAGTAAGETPLLRLTLIEVTRSPHGQILERVARLDPEELKDGVFARAIDSTAGGLVVTTRQVNGGASRLLDLRLPIPSRGEAYGVHYAVLVEEVTTTPRSTFSNEPIRGDADILEGEHFIESGVRFAVRVEIDEAVPPPEG